MSKVIVLLGKPHGPRMPVSLEDLPVILENLPEDIIYEFEKRSTKHSSDRIMWQGLNLAEVMQ